MTVSLKVHVNGRYRATVKHTVIENGKETTQPDTVVGPQEEKSINFRHGAKNVLEVSEEYLGNEVDA